MRAIKSEGTVLENKVEALLRELGYDIELHRKDLHGTPDFFIKYFEVAIQTHGCYWHGHDCYLCKPIDERGEWWEKKIGSQKARDERKLVQLSAQHRVLLIWECATRGPKRLDPDELKKQIDDWIRYGMMNDEITHKADAKQ